MGQIHTESRAGDKARPARVLPHRILLVDDQIDAADIAAMLLRHIGQDVLQVYDGESALEMAREFVPDIVVLDFDMPGLSGLDVAQPLRNLPPPVGDCRLIAYTGMALPEYRHAAQKAGFNDYLVKPVSMAQWTRILGGGEPPEPTA